MIGLERNGDVVRMASYAPLFAHTDAWQWRPDLIWVDNLMSYGTPNYYVQKLFANNAGDLILPVKLDAPNGTKLFASATRDNATGEAILKDVNGEQFSTAMRLDFGDAKNLAPKVKVFTLTSGNLKDENSFSEPQKVAPKASTLGINGPQFSYTFSANSLTVLRLGTSTRQAAK